MNGTRRISSRIHRRFVAPAAALAIAAALLPWPCHAQTADAPSLISFQGRLTDTQSNPLGGSHNFVFAVYPALAGGSALWTETQNAVTVTNGVLSVQLGSVTPIPPDVFRLDQAYLQITVDGAPLTPRQRLVSAPYALNSRLLKGRDYEALVSTDAAQAVGGQKTFLLQLSVSSDVYLSAGQLNVQGNRLTTPGGLLDAGKLTNALPALDGSALTGISATRVAAGGVDLSTVTAALAGKLSSTAGVPPALVDLSTVSAALAGKAPVGGALSPGQVDLSTVTAALAGKLSSTAGVSPGLVDLSTVTTALAGKLSAGAAVAPGQVDLSTVTSALAGKLSSTAGVAPGLVDLSTVTAALAGKMAVGAPVSPGQVDLSTVTSALAGKLSSAQGIAPGLIDLSTVTTALAGKLSVGAALTPGQVDLSTVTTALADKLSTGGGTLTGGLTFAASTLTVQGDAFSVGGSTLVVNSGRVGIGTQPGEALHIQSGNVLLQSSGEREIRMLRTDLADNPTFRQGRIILAGDGSPEYRFLFSDDVTAERSVFEFDEKGIVASVKPSVGSHFEGFISGEVNPLFRLNSFPAMQLEMGPGGATPTDVSLRRSAANTLSLLTGGAERVRVADGVVVASTLTVGGNAFSVGGSTLSVAYGNVGVGVAAPAQALHVAGKMRISDAIQLGNANFDHINLFSNELWLRTNNAPIKFDSNANGSFEEFTFTNSGRLGLGTVAPLSKLHVLDGDLRISTGVGQASRGIIFQDGTVQVTAGGGGEANTYASSKTFTDALAVAGDLRVGGASASTMTSTGRFLAANGTVGAPAYAFGSEPNTGMFVQPGNPNIEFSAGGQRRFLINTNGQINMPSGSAAVPGLSDITNQNAGLFMGNRFVAVTTDGSERLRATADGRVGVGTGSPLARLHVSSPSAVASESVLLVSSGTGVGQELLTVMGDGKAGFGTSAPATKLHVKGAGNNTFLALVESTENNSYLKFKNASSGAGDLSSGGLIGLDGGVDLLLWNAENGKLRFGVSGTERMTMLADGSVGIGATVPGSKLHVLDGDIRVSTGIGQPTRGIIFQDGTVQVTAAGGANSVARTGDTMTGSLIISASTLTVNGPIISTGTGGGLVVSGEGTRFQWVPSSSAFRAGYVSGTQWDGQNIGAYSTAFGDSTRASGDHATASGGQLNSATGTSATVGGGNQNTASGAAGATVAGGWGNTAAGNTSTIGGGASNSAPNGASLATVSGGYLNTASGQYSTIPGGYTNLAQGSYSFAAGNRAKASAEGSFVWADAQGVELLNTTTDQFLLRARGGFYAIASSASFAGPGGTLFTVDGSSAHFRVPVYDQAGVLFGAGETNTYASSKTFLGAVRAAGDVQVGDATASTLSAAGYLTLANLASAPGTAVPGRMYYDSALNTLRFSTGATASTWVSISTTPGGVPAGTVAHFNLAACPTGWTELTGARGRYMVGLPAGGTLAGTSGTALTDLESRSVGQHGHGVTDPGHAHLMGYNNGAGPGTGYTHLSAGTLNTTHMGTSGTTGVSVDNTGSVAGTNAPYLQLLVCQCTGPEYCQSGGSAASANTAANLSGGGAGSLPYQTGANVTGFLGIGGSNSVLVSNGSVPSWSTTPTLTGTNFTGIPDGALTSNVALLTGSQSFSGAKTFGAATSFPGSGIWNASGQVGVGTAAPASKLHVLDGDIRVSTGIGQASRGIIFQDGSVQTTAAGGGAGETNTFASSKTILGVLTATNSVRSTGWTATPGGTGAGVELMYISPNSAGSLLAYDRDASRYKILDYYGSDHRFYTNQSSNISAILAGDGSLGLGAYPTDASARLHVSSASASSSDTLLKVSSGTGVGQELLVVKGDGKVGVGKANPAYSLDVASNIRATGQYFATTGGGMQYVLGANGDYTTGYGLGWNGVNNLNIFAGNSSAIGVTSTEVSIPGGNCGGAVLCTKSNASYDGLRVRNSDNAYRFVVTNQGRVGVGLEIPAAALHVSSGGLLVDGNASAPFQVGASSLVLTSGGELGLGTSAPGQNLIGSGVGYDLTNTIAHVKSVAGGGGYASLALEGSAGSTLDLFDSGAAANKKFMRLRMDDGTAKFQSFQDDVNTAQADNILALDLTNGRTGFGTAAPTDRIQVVGQIGVDDDLVTSDRGCFRFNGTSDQLEYSNDCSSFQAFSASSGGGWVDDGTSVRLNTGTDNVGIGTASPQAQLHLSKPAGVVDPPNLILGHVDTTDHYSGIRFRDETSGNHKWGVGLFNDAYSVSALQNSFFIYQYKNKSEGAVENYRLTINDSGDVGLGTSSPVGGLHVMTRGLSLAGSCHPDFNGANVSAALDYCPGSGDFRVYSHGNAGVVMKGKGFGVGTWTPDAMLHVSSGNATSSDTLLKVSSGTGTGQELLALKGDGKLGLGTASPSVRLHVSRDAGAAHTELARFISPDSGARPYITLGNSTGAQDGPSSAGGYFAYDAPGGWLGLGIHGSNPSAIIQAGRVGINRTPVTEALEVQGAVRSVAASSNFGGGDPGMLVDYTGTVARLIQVNGASGSAVPLALGNGNAEWARIDTAGRLGVGTQAPLSKLHVLDGDIRVSSSIGQASRGIVFQDGSVQTTAAGSSQWATNATHIYNTNAGGVGIGIQSPTSMLEVRDNIRSGGAAGGFLTFDRTADAAGYSVLYRTGEVTRLYDNVAGDVIAYDEAGRTGVGTVSPTAKLHVSSDSATSVDTVFKASSGTAVGQELFVVKGDGKVGIGTSSPSKTLQVAGNMRIGGAAGGGQYSLEFPTDSGFVVGSNSTSGGGNSVVFGAYDSVSSNNSSAFGVSNTLSGFQSSVFGFGNTVTAQHSTALGEGITNAVESSLMLGPSDFSKVTIVSAGKVGVGTTAPTARLHVSSPSASSVDTVLNVSSGTGTGQELVVVKGDGKVGIGTSSPGAKLEVKGEARFGTDQDDYISAQGAGGTARVEVGGANTNVNLSLASKGTGSLYFWSGGYGATSRLFVNGSTGDTGLGTVSPLEKLDVVGSALVRGSLSAATGLVLGSQGGEYSGLGYNVKYTGTNNTYKYRAADSAAYLRMGGAPAFEFMVAGSGSADAGINFSTAMVILQGGNVGVGTTNPTVNGGGLEVSRNGQAGVRVTNTAGKAIEIGADATRGYIQTLTAGAHLDFFTGATAGPYMRIDNAGKVGIGTTDPGALLHIKGDGGSNSVPLAGLLLENTYNVQAGQTYIGFKNVGLTGPTTKLVGGANSAGGQGMFQLVLTNNSGTEFTYLDVDGASSAKTVKFPTGDVTVYGGDMRIEGSGNDLIDDNLQSFAGSNACWSSNVLGLCSSDRRLKENISYLPAGALDLLRKLKPATYDVRNGGEKGVAGFIAQEVQEVIPGLVRTNPTDGYLVFSQERVVPYAVKAIQELEALVARQGRELAELKAQLARGR